MSEFLISTSLDEAPEFALMRFEHNTGIPELAKRMLLLLFVSP